MLKFRDFITSEKSKEPHYLVTGHPVGHSLSPLMHRIALRHHGIEADYLAVDLLPGEIPSFISRINKPEFLGANVTIPYKKEFLSVVDELDESAEAVGALNTLVKRENRVTGYNTDVDGFRRPLEPFADRLEGGSVILFGTGGASLAVLKALEQLGAGQIVLVSRHPEQLPRGDYVRCSYHNWQAYADESVMLVNSTPLGMSPDRGGSPVRDEERHFLEGKICYDLVYNPRRTRFLRQAAEAGGETIEGLEMFIGQGDRAFELWTGKTFPRAEIAKALEAELDRRSRL